MESKNWQPLFDIPLSAHSTGVPYVRAANPTIDIICTSPDDDKEEPLSLAFTQNVNDDVGGVIWDCGLLLVDYILAHLRRNTQQQDKVSATDTGDTTEDTDTVDTERKSGHGLVLDLGTGTGVAGIVAALSGVPRCILTDYKAYPVMLQNLAMLQNLSGLTPLPSPSACSFEKYTWYAASRHHRQYTTICYFL